MKLQQPSIQTFQKGTLASGSSTSTSISMFSAKIIGIVTIASFSAASLFFIIYISITPLQQYPPSVTIAIAASNDLHGFVYPTLLARKDTGQVFGYGGLVYMAKIIQILRSQNNGNFLYLDAGDQFQGGFESSTTISSGEIMTDYFNHVNLGASAVGNHQFDFGPSFLTTYLQKLQNSIISANLINNSSSNSTNDYPLYGQQISKIFSFPINNPSPHISQKLKQIKIGVIGLSTIQTKQTTSGFVNNLFPSTYIFQTYKNIVIAQSASLKAQGAHIVMIVGHVGNGCNNDTTYGIWTTENQGNISKCNQTDQIFTLIDNLPEGTISAVVQGHRHTISHYFYKGIPIVGVINQGYYLNSLKLKFRIIGTEVTLNPDEIQIQGPIPVCEKIFQGTNKCEYVNPTNLASAGKLVNWKFHGIQMTSDTQLQNIISTKWGTQMAVYEVQICKNYIPYPVGKNYSLGAPISNLMTNIMASAMENQTLDFVVLNGGGFRTTWYPGVIRYQQLFSMFPFPNNVETFTMTGANLKLMIQTLQNGVKKFYPTWGLSQTFTNNSGTYTLTNLKLANGSNVIDSTNYKGASISFCLNGGDDFMTAKNNGVTFENRVVYPLQQTQLNQMQLMSMGYIDESSLADPSNLSRIIII